jgi:hypothetical protein
MKDDPRDVPPPLVEELLERLAEIIAERPPQPLTSELSGRLGEIVAERVAGLPPKQRVNVAQLTIIEILLTTPHADVIGGGAAARAEVPLTGLLRRHVALELARLWIPKKDLNKIYKRRDAKLMDSVLELANWSRETKAWEKTGDPPPESSAAQAVVELLKFERKRGRWIGRGVHSVAALLQYLKRWGPKKPQP